MNPKAISSDKKLRAYIIGLALGDGNLSNPNGRAVRLRITCDKKYPDLIKCAQQSLQSFLSDNKVAIVDRRGCVDVSCFSNYWPKILGWEVGSKSSQNVFVPNWIKENKDYARECLRGLLQTDGSIYTDRGYPMVNFVSYISTLAYDVLDLMQFFGYKPNMQRRAEKTGTKHTIRISKNTKKFIKEIGLWKT